MAYKVKKGDTLSQIAKAKGVTLQALLAANPNIKNANKIRVGQSIKMPDTKKMPGAKGGPYGRISQTEMNLMRSDGKAYTKGVRAKMKAGAETTPTPKKAAATKAAKDTSAQAMEKARRRRAAAKKKPSMAMPKPKPKNTNPVSKKTGSSLSQAALEKAKERKKKDALAKVVAAAKQSRRKGRKA